PQNMGAWTFIEPRLRALDLVVDYVGRDASASPATGSYKIHDREQKEIVETALTGSVPHLVKAHPDAVYKKLPLAEIEAGTKVAIGAVIGSIEESKAAPAKAAAPSPPRPPSPVKAGGGEEKKEAAEKRAPARAAVMSPSARALVESKGIDASQLTGSGRGGRITKEDVLARGSTGTSGNGPPAPTGSPAPTLPAPTGDRETRQRMSPIRQRIAARLVESQQTTASLTTFNEA